MTTYESQFTTVTFDAVTGLQEQFWKTTENFSNDDYKTEVSANADNVLTNNAKFLLSDTNNFNYTISPELQEWSTENFFARIVAAGIRKYAILLPQEVFAEISIQQTVEENTSNTIQVQYFENGELARKWLLG